MDARCKWSRREQLEKIARGSQARPDSGYTREAAQERLLNPPYLMSVIVALYSPPYIYEHRRNSLDCGD